MSISDGFKFAVGKLLFKLSVLGGLLAVGATIILIAFIHDKLTRKK